MFALSLKRLNNVTQRKRSWTDEQLINLVASSTTISEVVVGLGLKKTASGNWRTVQNHIERLNLDKSHFTGKAQFGSKNPARRNRVTLDKLLVANSDARSCHLKSRLYAEGLKTAICEDCGLSSWRGHPAALELDHVDGNPRNNLLSNLRILCLQCHALTPTWRGKKRLLGETGITSP